MNNEELVLHSFASVLPPYQGKQKDLVDWILKAHLRSMDLEGRDNQARLYSILKHFSVSDKLIERRFFECPDVYGPADDFKIYQQTPDQMAGVDILERNKFFSQRAQEVFHQLYQNPATFPQHLIHVTCTGYVSPSAPQIFFSDKPACPNITHAYHMGCYAALPAVRMAEALAFKHRHQVDLVHTEMCSLHLNPSDHSPEQMVVQTLFADGHIKYSMGPLKKGRGFKVIVIKEKLVANSQDDMTWIPGKNNMQMTLSKHVPQKIKNSIRAFITELAQDQGVGIDQLLRSSHFALHPGGPKIVEAIEEQLELSSEQTHFSRHILKQRGNMSSATLPHVWKDILESGYQGKVISLAFGPGLTIFGSIFEVTSK